MRSQQSELRRPVYSAITFDACQASEPPAPGLSALGGDRAARRQWLRHWLTDPAIGSASFLMHHAVRLASPRLAAKIGAHISRLAERRYRNGPSVARYRQSIARIRPDLADDPQRLEATLSAWWRNIGRVYAEYAQIGKISRKGLIEIEGREHLAAAHASGRPLIYCSVHLSNFELLLSLLSNGHLASGCVGIYEPQQSRFENAIIDRLRRRLGTRALPPGHKSAVLLSRHIREGGATLVYVDEVNGRQVHMPLFGRAVPVASNVVNAAKLALAHNGILLPIHMLRTPDGRFRVIVDPPFDPVEAPDRATRITATIRKISVHFEPIVERNIEQWFMLQNIRFRADDREVVEHLDPAA